MNKEDARRRLTVIENEAKKLRKMIEEPDVITVRKGDFGMAPRGLCNSDPHPVSADPRNSDHDYGFWLNEQGRQSCAYCSPNGLSVIRYGNVFDMMKDWDKPFIGHAVNLAAKGIVVQGPYVEIYACTNGVCRKEFGANEMTISEAEPFWHALGHAIVQAKRNK